jgi:sigma-E factor negative regulatory protein RseA
LSAAASLSAVAIVLTLVLTDNPLRPQAPIAAAPGFEPPVVAQIETQARPVAHQGRVNEYLMAHQEYSPSNAFQGVAPYVRTVSESHVGVGH